MKNDNQLTEELFQLQLHLSFFPSFSFATLLRTSILRERCGFWGESSCQISGSHPRKFADSVFAKGIPKNTFGTNVISIYRRDILIRRCANAVRELSFTLVANAITDRRNTEKISEGKCTQSWMQ